MIQSQTFFPPFIQSSRNGNNIFFYLIPEPLHILRRITDPVHPKISQTHIILKAQGFRLLVPVFHQPVKKLLQPTPLRLPGGSNSFRDPAPCLPV